MTAAQLPAGEAVFLDHVGHFVPDIASADDALRRCGFLPTPFSAQRAPAAKDGSMQPTGTGNICAMLEAGYLEVLAKTADTPIGRELDAALARWGGVHLAAFAVARAEAAHARLAAAGFPMRPIVRMRRPVEAEGGGMTEARFTVARIEAGAMPEGRIQMLTHHTEAAIWQRRWMRHPNGVTGLAGLLVASDEVEEAGRRFARFFGRTPETTPSGLAFALDRGSVRISPPGIAGPLTGAAPGLPWLAAYGLTVADLDAAADWLRAGGCQPLRRGEAVLAPFPPALGRGCWALVEDARHLPWL
jgi:hypothetical protein